MLVRLSTKGRVVIPHEFRKALGLKPGTMFDVRLDGQQIVFVPLDQNVLLDALYGAFKGVDLLSELERSHKEECDQDVS